MTLSKDGILSAVAREEELMPKTSKGKEITAWNRRGRTLLDAIDEIDQVRSDLDALKKELRQRPF